MKKLTALLIATLMLLTLFAGCSFFNKNDTNGNPSANPSPQKEESPEDPDLTAIKAVADKKADEITASIMESFDNFTTIFTEELHIKADETYTKKLEELRKCIENKTDVKWTDLKIDESDKRKATVKITVSMPDMESLFSNEKFTELLTEARANAQSEDDLTPYISILDTIIEEINNAKTRSVSGTGILKKNANDDWETTEILED